MRPEDPEIRLQPGETKLVPVSEPPEPDKIETEGELEGMKRWLRWNLVCLRGRRCGDVEVVDDYGTVPPGKEIRIHYSCEGCGTKYLYSSKHGRSRR